MTERRTRARQSAVVCATFVGLACARPDGVAAQSQASRSELRLDAIASRAPTLQLGAGAAIPGGLYVRLVGLAAGGLAVRDGDVRGAARVEGAARFLLDPFAERRVALYGIGGVSVLYDGFERWRPRLVVGLGIEGPPRGGVVRALELAFGGGARVGLVVRRARSGRR